MKDSNDTIGNRNRYLPACSAVPQPTATARTPVSQSAELETRPNNGHLRPRVSWANSKKSRD